MTTLPDSNQALTDTVRRYVSLLANGSADDLVALFAEDATVEDPVGSDVRTGRAAIHDFFSTLEAMDRQTELVLLRVVGNEAAFAFTITFAVGDTPMRLQPIDTMTFNEVGEIISLRSYFAPNDVTGG
jgi:steroid delta-isomerase